MDQRQPITELNETVRQKITVAMRSLEQGVRELDCHLVWNNLLFRDHKGHYYTTLHDFSDIRPESFHMPGPFPVSLYWIGEEIGAVSEIHWDVNYPIGAVDSSRKHV